MGTNTGGGPDSDAVRAQLEQCHEAAYGWALWCCQGNRIEAEEILQATYLKVLEGTAHFQGRSAFKTWLFAVIRKTVAEQRRRALVHRLILTQKVSQTVVIEPPPGPEENAHLSQVLLRVREALQVLPRRQCEVLGLVFIQDLTLQESATVLGITLGSARRHYERGKQRLRRLLGDLEEHDAF